MAHFFCIFSPGPIFFCTFGPWPIFSVLLADVHINSRWPKAQKNVLQHDAFSCNLYRGAIPFPTKRIGGEHVGSVWLGPPWAEREYDVKILLAAKQHTIAMIGTKRIRLIGRKICHHQNKQRRVLLHKKRSLPIVHKVSPKFFYMVVHNT